MLKVTIGKIRGRVDVKISRSGSVLKGDVEATVPFIHTRYDIESPDNAEAIARVIRSARSGCFVKAALADAVPLLNEVTLNGQAMEVR